MNTVDWRNLRIYSFVFCPAILKLFVHSCQIANLNRKCYLVTLYQNVRIFCI